MFEAQIKKRCFGLYDEKQFLKGILMPFRKRIPHDAGGVAGAFGWGFDRRVIHYGYPIQYLVDYTNLEPEKCDGFRAHFQEGPKTGHSTLRMPSGESTEAEYGMLFEPYGFRHGMQTFFFDRGGALQGVAKITKRSEPAFTDEEKSLWEGLAPYVFYAFRKYRWLLDAGFFVSHPNKLLLGIVLADGKGRIVYLNTLAREILRKAHGSIPSMLPEGLETPFVDIIHLSGGKGEDMTIFRDIEYSTPYGRVVALTTDESSKEHLPGAVASGAGKGAAFFIKPRIGTGIDVLGKREKEILMCLSRGMQDKSIAGHLRISDRTVQAHIRNIFQKVNATNRTEAALMAVKSGL